MDPISLRAELAEILAPQDALLLVRLFQGFILHRNKLSQAYLRRVIVACQDYTLFIRKAPWNASPRDFSHWVLNLAFDRRLAISTQRMNQTCVLSFYSYLATPEVNSLINCGIGNTARHFAGVRPVPHYPGRPSEPGSAEIR
jgi:hypothetical protein